MKKVTLCLAAALFLIPVMARGEAEGYYGYSFSRLSYVRGDVFVQRTSDLGYEKGEVNLAVVEGDKLGTTDGQAEIHFGRRNYLRLDESTQVEFVVLPREGDDHIKLHLLSGRIYLRVSDLGRDKDIEAHTPDASYYILDEGLYLLDVTGNNETELFVHEGSVEAAGENGSLVVEDRQKLSASNGELISEPASFYAGFDDFDRWNESRDGLLARRSYNSHLPSEIGEYEDELDENGRWVYEEPYGNVWVPRVYDADWRPYYYGRWVWYPVIGWNWVSSEPWGWCTYHYGRWHWRLGLGWYWIPSSVWGPAWVHWYTGYDYIGWCPLSWYNRPCVIINNRFYDRYDHRYYPVGSRALTMIRRSQLQSPNIHRHALGREAVRSLDRVSLSARQPDIRPSLSGSGLRSADASRALSRSGGREVGAGYSDGKGGISSGHLRRGGQGRLQRPAQGSVSSGRSAVQRRSLGTQSEARSPGAVLRDRPVISERGARRAGPGTSVTPRATRRNSGSQPGISGTRSSASGRKSAVTRREADSGRRELRSNATSVPGGGIQAFPSRSGSSHGVTRRYSSGYDRGAGFSRSSSSQVRRDSRFSGVREFRSGEPSPPGNRGSGRLPSGRDLTPGSGYRPSSERGLSGNENYRGRSSPLRTFSPNSLRRSGPSPSYSPGVPSASPRGFSGRSRSFSNGSPGVSPRAHSSGPSGSPRSISGSYKSSGGSSPHSSGSSGGVRRRN